MLWMLGALAATLGFMALVVDVGSVVVATNQLQLSCDAAALAGVSTPTNVVGQALSLYENNAMPGATDTPSLVSGHTYTLRYDTVTVTNPYSDATTTAAGYAAADCVEVAASRTLATAFAPLAGGGRRTTSARAVAWRVAGGDGAFSGGQGTIFALDQGFALTCNGFTVSGSVFSNSSIAINLNNISIGNTLHSKTSTTLTSNKITGHFNLQYGTTYKITSNNTDIASYTQTPQTDVTPPINYDPANYATDFQITQSYSSSVNISASGVVWPAGTYYINGDLNISANNADLSKCTFIVNGNITVNTNNAKFSPNQNYMCLYALGGGTISLNQNNISVTGDVYAPKGYIYCISNNTNYGWWEARRITVNCNNFNLEGIAGRTGSAGSPKLVE
jgi:hypothetical protein